MSCRFLGPNVEARVFIDAFQLVGYCQPLHKSIPKWICHSSQCPRAKQKGVPCESCEEVST